MAVLMLILFVSSMVVLRWESATLQQEQYLECITATTVDNCNTIFYTYKFKN